MESPFLGLILDSSVIIAAERKRQSVEDLLMFVGKTFGEIEIAISAVTLAELVHGVARANTPEIRQARRAFIDELKKHGWNKGAIVASLDSTWTPVRGSVG